MELDGRTVLVCNCEHTMEIDGEKLCAALNSDAPLRVHSHLCRTEIGVFEKALDENKPLLVACTQEAPLFRELAEERGKSELPAFTNIRERAGWSDAKGRSLPKIAALLAEATAQVAPAGMTTLKSDGVCLVYGSGQAALDVAHKLSARLNVTLLLSSPDDLLPPSEIEVPIYRGEITAASGHFGAFEITVNGYAPMVTSSRSSVEFLMPRDGAVSSCDLIFDMSGAAPLFSSPRHRDGYFHIDPGQPAAVANGMFEIVDLVGEFEKPLYVIYDGEICAHSRSQKTGCTRCLDVCPASAITSAGDLVSINPAVCGGCGSCAAVCPSGAVSYTYPGRVDVIARAQLLARAFKSAGGTNPHFLVHDDKHGTALIAASARYGRGLPANVLPFAVNEVTSLGHDVMASVLAAGVEAITVLASPERRDELSGLEGQIDLVNTVMSAMGYGDAPRVNLLVEQDPDALETMLYQTPVHRELKPAEFLAVGGKRDIARTAFGRLNEQAPLPQTRIPLPDDAPYGRIQVNAAGCTLCLACVSACPANAIHDNPDKPQIRFLEQACVQCGLCRTTCPENVISLEPSLDLTPEALVATVLNEEEPFECVSCGKPFGTKSSVEHVLAKLGGQHSMFQNEDTIQLIKMCDDCRIETQAMGANDPFAQGTPPRIRTTEDYLAAEDAVKAGKKEFSGLSIEDFLKDED